MSSDRPFSPIADILDDLKQGRLIVLVDAEDRENEGDLVCAAELVTPEIINFMLLEGRGTLCVPLTIERCDELQLPQQVMQNTSQLGTAFTVTVDAHRRFGITTGVSANDRATTIRLLADPIAKPADLVRPGHVNPLRARPGGVLVRAGQTEGSVDLCRLAGLQPASCLIEIMNPDGTMARVPELIEFCKRHDLKMCTIADLIEYRQQREILVERVAAVRLPTWHLQEGQAFTCIGYRSVVDPRTHVALALGGIGEPDDTNTVPICEDPVLVRVHSECLTGDVFHSLRCDCGEQLHAALQMIANDGRGVLLYLRQEGRGIGLMNKLHAYAVQDKLHLDTVEANKHLGFPADKRDYGIGAQILRDLGVRKVRILTNNPKKVSRLEVYGLTVVEQIPIEMPATPYNRAYLQAKRDKLGHLLQNV